MSLNWHMETSALQEANAIIFTFIKFQFYRRKYMKHIFPISYHRGIEWSLYAL
jgi:hypothetical protein